MKFLTHERTRVAALAAILLVGLAGCGGEDSPSAAVTVSVETDYAAAVPGESITLLWRFAIADDWHLYWMGRNDSGFPPAVEIDLPEGWIAGGLQWPAPERHLSDGEILDHVYYRELVLVQQVRVPADAPTTGELGFDADVEWLACRDECVPGRATLPVTIPLAPVRSGGPSAAATAALAALPRPAPDGLLEGRWDGATYRLSGPPGSELVFMPTTDCGDLVNLVADGVGAELALRCVVSDGTVGPLRGLVRVAGGGAEPRAHVINVPVQALTTNPNGG